ncbi:FAD dependent oxidoreductase [Aequoribacter fuscus]|uniref:FAD dependent oxidoreductase n=2 Tax=Aequoribacter fuscus TaxID=2518989 RepID=F3L5D6_9GAMM|nr:FAD dependent oxidoreductase [Aequoribacter fuscus]
MTKSARSFLDGWFENEHIKAVFGFDAVVGNYASPDTPGSAYVLLHHVFGELDGEKGAWGHAVGGMGAITQTMAQACSEHGVEIRTDAEVASITIKDKAVMGVVLTSGELITAHSVAANVTPKMLYQQLISPEDVPNDFAQKIASTRYGSGTFRLNVALSELPDFTCLPGTDLQEHHQSGIIMAPTLEYMDRAFMDAKQQGWANKPIVEMLIPSTVDDSLAPAGQHVCSLFCQQFAPTLSAGQSWDDLKPKAVEAIVSVVSSHAPNFKASILGMRVLSPLDLERELGLTGGDIFHGAMTLDQLWAARPVFDYGDYRGPIRGLYHCGSGAHPGGGVTGLPGKNAAEVILMGK